VSVDTPGEINVFSSTSLGASSSKWFTALIIIMCISGMFGSFRWFKVGDADLEEAVLVK
jgi:hypothetical protein